MNILVNGVGNIGTTMINLLSKYRSELNIDKLFLLKNKPMPWHFDEMKRFAKKGIIVLTRENDEFGHPEDYLNEINYVFDCMNNGGGNANKKWYEQLPALTGACAQGSEKGFGTSFMSGLNNDKITGKKFVHIVSCNTHAIGSLITALCDGDYNEINSADFVIVRRSEDIGNHQRLVTSNVVARHLDPVKGTHHSIDVLDLFDTINVTIPITSSDITTPSQLMHGVRFNITLKNLTSKEDIQERLNLANLVSTTTKFDSNVIFELGRRYGFQGRIFSHAVVISNNILVNDFSIQGWAFIPQEGNTILSSIHAYLLQTEHPEEKKVMHRLTHDLFQKNW